MKKITRFLCMVIPMVAGVQAYANSEMDDQATQSQSLQQQIDELKKQIANMQQTGSTTDAPELAASREESPFAMTDGQIQYVAVHGGDDITPIGMINQNRFAEGILKQRNQFDDYSMRLGAYLEINPEVWNGSDVQTTGSKQVKSSGGGVYLNEATLFSVANLGRWVTAEMDFTANQKGNASVRNALVMFGNLEDYPLFFTIGKNRLSVGSFSGGGPFTNQLTTAMFRPGRVSNMSAAFSADGLYSNITLFNTNQGAGNFSYALFYADSITENLAYTVNGGYMYNVNGTGNTSLASAYEYGGGQRIGALNFNAALRYDEFGVGAGWAMTTNKSTQFTVEGNNVNTGAWYASMGYSPILWGDATNFSVSYSQSYNASNVPITLSSDSVEGFKVLGVDKQLIVSAQRPLFTPKVLIGPEYTYMHIYNGQHTNSYMIDISVYL